MRLTPWTKVAVLLSCTLLLLALPSPSSAASEVLPRLAGNNRYATAVEISRIGWPNGAATVILARSDNIADALAGIPLAHIFDAPVLLTDSKGLARETKNELTRLNPDTVFILGGTAAISQAVSNELSSDYEVTRIAGANRFETAAKIAELVAPRGAESVIIVNGNNWPDALAVAPFAATEGSPVLLNGADNLHPATENVLAELSPNTVVIVGGFSAIGPATEASLSTRYTVTRIAGNDRYSTAVELTKHYCPNPSSVYFASGLNSSNGVDAIAGAALAAKNGLPLLLTGNTLPADVSKFIKESAVKDAVLLGGESAVSSRAEKDILENLAPAPYYLQAQWPTNGTTDFFPKYTYLTLTFSQDMKIDNNYLEKILLFGDGKLVPIRVEVGHGAEYVVLVIPEREMILNTQHRLYIPGGILLSAEGVPYPRTIDITFKTAHTVLRGTVLHANDEDLSIRLHGTMGIYRTSVNPDGVFLLTNMLSSRYTLDVLTAAGKVLYTQTIDIKAGQIYRPEILLISR